MILYPNNGFIVNCDTNLSVQHFHNKECSSFNVVAFWSQRSLLSSFVFFVSLTGVHRVWKVAT